MDTIDPTVNYPEGQTCTTGDGTVWTYSAGIWNDGNGTIALMQELLDERGPVTLLVVPIP